MDGVAGLADRLFDLGRAPVTPVRIPGLDSDQRPVFWQRTAHRRGGEQVQQSDLVNAAAVGVELSVDLVSPDHAYGARVSSELGRIDDDHGVGFFEFGEQREPDRTAVDEFERRL